MSVDVHHGLQIYTSTHFSLFIFTLHHPFLFHFATINKGVWRIYTIFFSHPLFPYLYTDISSTWLLMTKYRNSNKILTPFLYLVLYLMLLPSKQTHRAADWQHFAVFYKSVNQLFLLFIKLLIPILLWLSNFSICGCYNVYVLHLTYVLRGASVCFLFLCKAVYNLVNCFTVYEILFAGMLISAPQCLCSVYVWLHSGIVSCY